MQPRDPDRPDPEAFLREAAREGRGQLKVFLGAAPGVGKTYEMLEDGAARKRGGLDVVVGVVETHGRAETEALTRSHEIMPRREIAYEGRTLTEMDLDGLLARRPQLALVDELAHSNAPGSRHPKRYQDVEELLAAGIDVYSTINIQHIESLNDVVASFTRVRVRETVPDRILEDAEIEVVDIPPDELIERLKDGKVYIPQEATRALSHFFSKSNLTALRELALRRAAQTVDAQMLDYVRANALAGNWAAGERIVVAVSELPGADGLVRAAKRLADALRAPWTAVHIETPRASGFDDEQRRRLASVFQLATQLGGAVASVPAQSVIEGLKSFTLEARATQLVVGKSERSRWFEFRHGSVVDRLVRETPGVAVHVMPVDVGAGEERSARASKAIGHWGPPLGYAVALVMVALVTLLGLSLAAFADLTNLALLYLVPVMTAATLYGLRTGLVTGLASALAYNFFFLPPTGTLTVQDPENIVTLVVLLGVAVVVSQLAGRVRGQAELATESARQNSALAGFARQLSASNDVVEVGQALCAEVSRLMEVSAVLLLPEPAGLTLRAAYPPEDRLGPVDLAAANWAFDKGVPAGTGSETLTASDWRFQPLLAGQRSLAVLGIASPGAGDPVRPDQLPFLLSLADQAALALERVRLASEMEGVGQLRERERLRAALLSSLSHDLRTPLTALVASITELKLTGDHPVLVAGLDAEAQRLQRFISNLLDLVRIEAGALRLNIEPVDLTDAVAAAVHDLRAALKGHHIDLQVSPDLPLVRLDPQLLHHCLLNLLDNAGKYGDAGSPVTVAARRDPDAILLTISDEGPGLPPGRETEMFETFARFDGSDRHGGTGLGLAIVKGFAEAMGLSVSAANRPDRTGASFTLRMPATLLVRANAPA